MAELQNILGASAGPRFFLAQPTPLWSAPAPPAESGDTIRLYARSLAGMQKEALAVSAQTGQAWRLASDEGAYLNGYDEAPFPLAFMTTGMVAGLMTEVLALAQRRGIDLGKARLTQDNYYTMKGSALRGDMTGGARDVELTLHASGPASADELQGLLLDAVGAAAIGGLLRGSHPGRFTLRHNGATLSLQGAEPFDGEPQALPQGLFEAVRPSSGDWNVLLERGPMTEKAAHTVTLEGGSLQAEQDRLLHVRGDCTVRPDGVKQIEVSLFNPHGRIFRFLSDEPGEGGAPPRAPGAAAYIAAGIGFCFMTQIGRYAAIRKLALKDYAIVQDLHLSAGGASSGSGQAGRMTAPDTHLALVSTEDDATARAILDMGEQTCFLHAFCKTDLKFKLKTAGAAS